MKKIIIAILIILVLCSVSYAITQSGAEPYLTHFYPFTGDSTDSVGGSDWTNFGAALTSDIWGNANSAYYFSHDQNDTMLTGSDIYMNGSDGKPHIISAWVHTNDVTGAQKNVFGCAYNANNEGVYVTNDQSSGIFIFGAKDVFADDDQIRVTTLGNNETYLVTFIHNGTHTFGCLNTTCDDTMDIGGQGQPIKACDTFGSYLGAEGAREFAWDGMIDNVIVYNYTIADITEAGEWATMIYNNGDEFNPVSAESATDIIIANDTYESHSINFTSDGGQSCGLNTSGQNTTCGPTSDTTPTFRATPETFNADSLWKLVLYNDTYYDYSDVPEDGARYDNCSLSASDIICTRGTELSYEVHDFKLTGKSGALEGVYESGKFEVDIESCISTLTSAHTYKCDDNCNSLDVDAAGYDITWTGCGSWHGNISNINSVNFFVNSTCCVPWIERMI